LDHAYVTSLHDDACLTAELTELRRSKFPVEGVIRQSTVHSFFSLKYGEPMMKSTLLLKSTRMMKSTLLLKCLLISLLLASCSVDLTSKKSTSVSVSADFAATQKKTVTSQDGLIQLTLPDTWQDIWTTADQEQWSLLVGERSQLTQIGIRSIARADYPTITPEMHAQAALTAGKAPFADAEAIEQNRSITVNGYPAVRYQMAGTTAGQRLVTLSLSVVTPNYYHGILVVSSEADFTQKQDELNQIIQTLQEVQGSSSSQ
jgi:hypothetical protein